MTVHAFLHSNEASAQQSDPTHHRLDHRPPRPKVSAFAASLGIGTRSVKLPSGAGLLLLRFETMLTHPEKSICYNIESRADPVCTVAHALDDRESIYRYGLLASSRSVLGWEVFYLRLGSEACVCLNSYTLSLKTNIRPQRLRNGQWIHAPAYFLQSVFRGHSARTHVKRCRFTIKSLAASRWAAAANILRHVIIILMVARVFVRVLTRAMDCRLLQRCWRGHEVAFHPHECGAK